MKRLAFISIILAAMALSAGAQAMTAAPMMTAAPAMNSSDSAAADASGMMADDMSYDALKTSGKLADVKMGMQLRTAKSGAMKVAYKNLMAAEDLAAKEPTILFFAADWCPSCQADLKDINANGKRLGKVNVVVVDYDKSAELKAKYGITVQDTFVQIDAMGAKLGIWNGGGVDGILKNVAKAM